jgi:malate dehydrogenase (oxaloacetate-decarboxylating)
MTHRSPTSPLPVALTGTSLINSPRLNKGTAFDDRERDEFELHGLLPPHVGSLELQVQRRERALEAQPSAFHKYTFLRDLQDTNETLFYALLERNVEKLLPLVYTPTVGEGCQRFSEIWRKPRGLFLSYPNKERIPQILSKPHYDAVKCIVVSDGERILGLGDQGAGGMGIPIGKLALYTALGGIPPESCLPILLDVGTDNSELLGHPLYIGWRNRRVRGADYDAFVETFVAAVQRRWPHVLLQWEDFAGANASRLLARFRDRLCTFNDDIQGTAAVAVATLLSAIQVTGVPLDQQRIIVVGFGSAGLGIASLLAQLMLERGVTAPHRRFYPIDRFGLVTDDMTELRPEQLAYARRRDEGLGSSLEEVVRCVQPTVLIGVSGQPRAFSEAAVREMARHAERPVIFPLSNPTSRAEAHPQDLMDWTDGRALIGTGSPFEPVTVGARRVAIDQTNNSYIFPGLALGIIATRARRVSDAMIMAAATELARHAPTASDRNGALLPPLASARSLSRAIALAVGRQAVAEGHAALDPASLEAALDANSWEPVYVPYRRVASSAANGG